RDADRQLDGLIARDQQLHERLVAWRLGVNAQLPQPNPKYDPKKPEYTPLMNNPKQKKKV
ncbi:MAG: hypothetical protein ACK5E4_14680, partial [Planctomycetia bacterium]